MDCKLPVSSVHGIFPLSIEFSLYPWNSAGKNSGVGKNTTVPSPGDLPNPGIEHRSPALQADSLPSEPPGKPKNTREGSLSLLQGIFPTKESNRGLLHCRRILYQLRYQRSCHVKTGKRKKKNIVILKTLGNARPEGQWSLNVLEKIACWCQAFAFLHRLVIVMLWAK